MLEEIRRLRDEFSERIHELEERIKRLENLTTPARLIMINWRIARIEASAHRILSSARNTLTSIPELEKDLKEYFVDLGELIKVVGNEVGTVSWDLVKACTSIIIHAAKEAGLPFRIIASIAVEKLGASATEAIDENVIKEVYGLVDWDYWKRLVSGARRP